MKIAIVIMGVQNSGKTETLRRITKTYTGKPQKNMRAGWRQLMLFPEFQALKLHCYFVPSSPTESDNALTKRFKNWKPEIIFMAEQIDGKNEKSTFEFLEENKYQVLRFELSNRNEDGIWDRFSGESKSEKLTKRATIIMDKLNTLIAKKYFAELI